MNRAGHPQEEAEERAPHRQERSDVFDEWNSSLRVWTREAVHRDGPQDRSARVRSCEVLRGPASAKTG